MPGIKYCYFPVELGKRTKGQTKKYKKCVFKIFSF